MALFSNDINLFSVILTMSIISTQVIVISIYLRSKRFQLLKLLCLRTPLVLSFVYLTGNSGI